MLGLISINFLCISPNFWEKASRQTIFIQYVNQSIVKWFSGFNAQLHVPWIMFESVLADEIITSPYRRNVLADAKRWCQHPRWVNAVDRTEIVLFMISYTTQVRVSVQYLRERWSLFIEETNVLAVSSSIDDEYMYRRLIDKVPTYQVIRIKKRISIDHSSWKIMNISFSRARNSHRWI